VQRHESFTERAPKLGGLVEFYRSPDRVRWTPTGVNVPDYPKLAQLWWQQIGDVNSGAFTPQQAMDRLAERDGHHHGPHAAADEANNTYGGCGPRLNEEKDASEWLGKPGAKGQARQRESRKAKPSTTTTWSPAGHSNPRRAFHLPGAPHRMFQGHAVWRFGSSGHLPPDCLLFRRHCAPHGAGTFEKLQSVLAARHIYPTVLTLEPGGSTFCWAQRWPERPR
jgi:hypothetical protein